MHTKSKSILFSDKLTLCSTCNVDMHQLFSGSAMAAIIPIWKPTEATGDPISFSNSTQTDGKSPGTATPIVRTSPITEVWYAAACSSSMFRFTSAKLFPWIYSIDWQTSTDFQKGIFRRIIVLLSQINESLSNQLAFFITFRCIRSIFWAHRTMQHFSINIDFVEQLKEYPEFSEFVLRLPLFRQKKRLIQFCVHLNSN